MSKSKIKPGDFVLIKGTRWGKPSISVPFKVHIVESIDGSLAIFDLYLNKFHINQVEIYQEYLDNVGCNFPYPPGDKFVRKGDKQRYLHEITYYDPHQDRVNFKAGSGVTWAELEERYIPESVINSPLAMAMSEDED